MLVAVIFLGAILLLLIPVYMQLYPDSAESRTRLNTNSEKNQISQVSDFWEYIGYEREGWTRGPSLIPQRLADESIESYKKYRKNMAIAWARLVLNNPDKYLILDTETTGIGRRDVIVQLAVIKIDGTPVIDTLIRPSQRKTISKEATNVHGITMRMLKGEPTLLDIAKEFADAVKGKVVITYNAEFDEDMLFQTMIQDEFQKRIEFKMNCAMKHYSAFVGVFSEYHRDFKFQKLPGGDHTASGDCLATLEIIKLMASEKLEFPVQI